jgi:hypothetical protein
MGHIHMGLIFAFYIVLNIVHIRLAYIIQPTHSALCRLLRMGLKFVLSIGPHIDAIYLGLPYEPSLVPYIGPIYRPNLVLNIGPHMDPIYLAYGI